MSREDKSHLHEWGLSVIGEVAWGSMAGLMEWWMVVVFYDDPAKHDSSSYSRSLHSHHVALATDFPNVGGVHLVASIDLLCLRAPLVTNRSSESSLGSGRGLRRLRSGGRCVRSNGNKKRTAGRTSGGT